MFLKRIAFLGFLVAGLVQSVFASAVEPVSIPMQTGSAHTFYIKGKISGLISTRFMVDTGSGFTTINEDSLAQLLAAKRAVYTRDMIGVLADGSEKRVPVYRVSSLTLGDHCKLIDVEAVVFPGKTRQILGLNALRQSGSFRFSFEPAELVLSQCGEANS